MRREWGKVKRMVVVWLSWLSGSALVAQSRSVLGSTFNDCWPFHFPYLNSFIYEADLNSFVMFALF